MGDGLHKMNKIPTVLYLINVWMKRKNINVKTIVNEGLPGGY